MSDQNQVFTPGTQYRSNIEADMQDAYLRYSMSVIVARALPDVRDGMKPVHRRVLFGMDKVGAHSNTKTIKSARIVGEVIGKYHPHGDASVYDTLVRLAQDFSLRYPLVIGQGNFGNLDGDPAAAMRYTEAKLSPIGELMLEELEKDTVDMAPNYDASLDEPTVLPSVLPNLLVNGSSGIAVGMATNMAPHNLREITNAIHAVCENPQIAGEDLLKIVTGPDFPTGAIICGRSGIRDAYLTGSGKVRVRSRLTVEEDSKGKSRIIVTEIPYMVNKAQLVMKIAELIKEKKVEGISDLRDESTKDVRIVIELKKDAVADVVLNNLYKYTQLQDTFSIYNLALVNKQPKVLTLKELIELYIEHRIEVIIRRCQFDLKKAKDRLHILDALLIAQKNIDEVVRIIRSAQSPDEAKEALKARFALDDVQAQAIVDMRLRALTGLEHEKLQNEYDELTLFIKDLEDILARRERQIEVMLARLDEITAKYGDERRSTIDDTIGDDVDVEDLIAEEEQVITLSKEGYIKRLPIDTFKTQRRGGKGIIGTGLKDEDNVEQIFTASTHSYLLIFTNKGRVHWTKVYRLPEGTRSGKGRPIVNFIELTDGEKVQAIVPVRKFGGYFCLVFATKKGVINKMDLTLFSHPRRAGVNAISLDEGDELVKVQLVGMTAEEYEAQNSAEVAEADVVEEVENEATEGEEIKEHHLIPKDMLMLATRKGQAIVFPIGCVRSMGRGTHGVRGINLAEGDEVISLLWLKPENKVLTISEKGYSKRTEPDEYRVTRRGGKGVRNLNITDKTGEVVFVESVADDYDLIITTSEGQVIRIEADTIRLTGRVSQGVKAITLNGEDLVQDATALPSVEDIEHDSEEAKATFENVEGVEVDDDSEVKSEESETPVDPEA